MKKVGKVMGMVLAASCVMGMAAGCNKNDEKTDVEYIKDKGTFVVGITVYEPMDYIGEDGEWTGFDAVLANKIGEKLDVTVQFVVINWANKVAELNSKNIDCIWNGMTASTELDESIDFSVAYAMNSQVAVVKSSNTTITNLETIKAAKVAVESGSAGDTVATETIKAATINRMTNGQTGALNEVVSGNSDVAVIDYTMAYNVVGKNTYAALKIVQGVEFGKEVFAVGVRTGSDLAATLNESFKGWYEDGTLTALASEYGVGLNEEALKAL